MQGEAVEWSRRCRGSTSPSKRRKNVLGRLLTNPALLAGDRPFCHDKGLYRVGPSRQLLCALTHVNKLQRDLSKRYHTVDVTGVRPMLKEGADRPEDEVPGRVYLVGRPLNRIKPLGIMLLKDLLVGCDPDCCCHEDGQETCPAAHAGPSEC